MNKKLLLGCLVVSLLGLIVVSVSLYVFVYRPARDYLSGLLEMGEVAEMSQAIEDKRAYEPPSDGLLTEQQVERFVAVQRGIITRLGERSANLSQKYQPLAEGLESGGTPSFSDLLSAWRDIGGIIREAKQAQVDGINANNFSEEEYRWVRDRSYLGVGANLGNIDFSRIGEAIETQNPQVLFEQNETKEALPDNQQLVEPYREESAKWLPFALFGL
jgi:hypothetical protein